jgi:hypothetical protein
MDIGSVLSRAWQIIWKHKILWIFGILAGCTGGGGTGSGGGSSWQSSGGDASGFGPFERFFSGLERFFANIPEWQLALLILGFIAVMIVLVVISVFLGTIGRIGLIRGTQQAEQGRETLAFGELFSGSMPYFWRVFLLSLAVGLAMAVVGIIVAIVVVFGSIVTLGIGALCLVPLACLLVPVAWVVQVLIEQSSVAIVVEDLSIMDGLRRGWEVIKANAGTFILMWLILILGIGIVGGLIIGLPALMVIGPAAFGFIAGSERALTSGLIVAGVCLACYIPIAIVLNGILSSFTGVAWTLTFMRLTRPAQQVEAEEPAL